MRNANGTGSVYKLHGNRRRPYTAVVSVGVELTDDKAKIKRKTLGYYRTQKEARQALAEYNALNLRSDSYDFTLNQIWQHVKQTRYSDASKSRIRAVDTAFARFDSISNKPIRELKTADLQECFDSCDGGWGLQAVMKTTLSLCYKYALENDICMKDYSDFIVIPQYETKIERVVLSERVSDLEFDLISPYNDIVQILLYSGCRTAEILADTTSFDLQDMTINITKAKNRSSVRVIPIHPEITDAVRRFIALEEKPIYQRIYRATKELGFTPHDCRHTFATRCHECGLNELVIQRLLGHTPETITQKVYTHLTINELRTELNKLNYL